MRDRPQAKLLIQVENPKPQSFCYPPPSSQLCGNRVSKWLHCVEHFECLLLRPFQRNALFCIPQPSFFNLIPLPLPEGDLYPPTSPRPHQTTSLFLNGQGPPRFRISPRLPIPSTSLVTSITPFTFKLLPMATLGLPPLLPRTSLLILPIFGMPTSDFTPSLGGIWFFPSVVLVNFQAISVILFSWTTIVHDANPIIYIVNVYARIVQSTGFW